VARRQPQAALPRDGLVASFGLAARRARPLTLRTRVLAFGAAGLAVAGGIGAAVAGGLVGQVLAIALITLGLGAVLLLLFSEVGLSEERDLARPKRRRRR
jgi:hypothetical protein